MNLNLHDEMRKIAMQAKEASRQLAVLKSEKKIHLLHAMADSLENNAAEILKANEIDMNAGRAEGLSSALLDRLLLTPKRIQDMAKGLREVAALPDPVGVVLEQKSLPSGLLLKKIRVPIGVIAIIFESRPNVTSEAAALCVKSSNAVILRGGKEAIHSNRAIMHALDQGWQVAGGPAHALQLVTTTDRDAVVQLVQLKGLIDLAIPRGGEGLIRALTTHAHIPVIKHEKGVCHIYVDAEADLKMALEICDNAKCQRPSACNAMETLLVHQQVAAEFLPLLAERLTANGVALRGDDEARYIVPTMKVASEDDWSTEYLDLILAVRVVNDVHAAMDHIARYGSNHSDAIISRNPVNCDLFLQQVDSAVVYANASTRFTDGGQFGMGAEMGISTDKIHARGPMGLEELTTYKWVVTGSGQIRD